MSDEIVPQNQAELTLEAMKDRLVLLEDQIHAQADEIESLNARLPESDIISPHFLKRAFTVWGHYVVAGFIITVPVMCLMIFFAFITGVFSQF